MTSGKKTETKVATLKGQEAEDAVFQYLKRTNRPFGAVDVSSKGVVPKTATQKILLTLTEKGEITQKTYGQYSPYPGGSPAAYDGISGSGVSCPEGGGDRLNFCHVSDTTRPNASKGMRYNY